MKKADEGVIAIYAKMRPEAAAAQMAIMEDATAAALLAKLNPRVASSILNEMDAGQGGQADRPDLGKRQRAEEIVMTNFVRTSPLVAGLLCSGSRAAPPTSGVEPYMTPVGAGLATNADPAIAAFTPPVPRTAQSLFVESGATIYRQQRASKVGDIVTVNIAINDQATLGNTTGRSTTAGVTGQVDWSLVHSGQTKDDATSTSNFQGQGNIARSEQIQVSVATVVTGVLPNGNLLLSRIAGSPRQLRASPPDASAGSCGPAISTATTRSPTPRLPRRAFPTAAEAGWTKSSSRPGASRSRIDLRPL